MSFELYKLLHLFGLFLVFVSFGGLALHAAQGGTRETLESRGLVMGTHGVGLLIVIVSGFGMLARLGLAQNAPLWSWAKLGIWLIMGGLVVPLMRSPSSGKPLWIGLPVLGLLAGWLAIYKPF